LFFIFAKGHTTMQVKANVAKTCKVMQLPRKPEKKIIYNNFEL
jgi:hypothetical protein